LPILAFPVFVPHRQKILSCSFSITSQSIKPFFLFFSKMPYHYYALEVKSISVKLLMEGRSPSQINKLLGYNVAAQSYAQWKALFIATCAVVCDPAEYLARGQPLRLTQDQSDFMCKIIQVDPTLYVDEIQALMKTQLGLELSWSTIYNKITVLLDLHRLVDCTVNPAQCPFKRAQFSIDVANIPAEYLVFTGRRMLFQ
jgi:hypothetical protein